jgi:hypothetical protein
MRSPRKLMILATLAVLAGAGVSLSLLLRPKPDVTLTTMSRVRHGMTEAEVAVRFGPPTADLTGRPPAGTPALAGPAMLAGVGWLYWQRCGESLWDKFVLVEISVVAVAYFILALTAVADRGRWRDLSPLAVADLAHRLRWRALAIVAAALGVLALGLLMLAGVAEVHRGSLRGWLMLTGGWFIGVFVGTFFARLLGVWCYLTRPR